MSITDFRGIGLSPIIPHNIPHIWANNYKKTSLVFSVRARTIRKNRGLGGIGDRFLGEYKRGDRKLRDLLRILTITLPTRLKYTLYLSPLSPILLTEKNGGYIGG